MTITIHYIDSNYVLCSHLLETKEITQAHTRFKSPSFLTDEEKQPLLEFIEARVIDKYDNTLVTVEKGIEIQRKRQTHQRRNHKAKGSYGT